MNQPNTQPYPVPSAIHDHPSSVRSYHWSPVTSPSDWPSLEEANKLSELGFSGQKGFCWERFCEFDVSGKGKQVGVGSSSFPSKAVPGLVEEIMNQKQGIFFFFISLVLLLFFQFLAPDVNVLCRF